MIVVVNNLLRLEAAEPAGSVEVEYLMEWEHCCHSLLHHWLNQIPTRSAHLSQYLFDARRWRRHMLPMIMPMIANATRDISRILKCTQKFKMRLIRERHCCYRRKHFHVHSLNDDTQILIKYNYRWAVENDLLYTTIYSCINACFIATNKRELERRKSIYYAKKWLKALDCRAQ